IRGRQPAVAAMAALALAIGETARADATVDFSAGITHDSNVTRAQQPEDIRPDTYVEGRAGAAWRLPVGGEDDAVELGLAVRGAQYFRHPLLSFAAIDGELAYWRKFGLGREAPWLRASVRGAVEDYRDDTRDSSVLDL